MYRILYASNYRCLGGRLAIEMKWPGIQILLLLFSTKYIHSVIYILLHTELFVFNLASWYCIVLVFSYIFCFFFLRNCIILTIIPALCCGLKLCGFTNIKCLLNYIYIYLYIYT